MKAKFPLIAAGAMGVGAVLAFALPAGASVSVQSQSPPTGTVKLTFDNRTTTFRNLAAAQIDAI